MRKMLAMCVLIAAGCQGIPEARHSPLAGAVTVKEVHDSSVGSSVDVSIGQDTLYVDAVSPRGIGGTRLQLNMPAWPKKIVVRLRYSAAEPFANLEGPGAALEGALTPPGKPEEYLSVQRITIDGTRGFEIAPMPQTDKRVLYLFWVDSYRR